MSKGANKISVYGFVLYSESGSLPYLCSFDGGRACEGDGHRTNRILCRIATLTSLPRFGFQLAGIKRFQFPLALPSFDCDKRKIATRLPPLPCFAFLRAPASRKHRLRHKGYLPQFILEVCPNLHHRVLVHRPRGEDLGLLCEDKFRCGPHPLHEGASVHFV